MYKKRIKKWGLKKNNRTSLISLQTTYQRSTQAVARDPSPRHLKSPDPTRIQDNFIRSFQQYAEGCRADMVSPICIKAWSWNNRVMQVDLTFVRRRMKSAFELLGSCFDELTLLIRDSNPFIFIYIYLAFLRLPHEVGNQLLSHAMNLSKTNDLEKQHPLRLMFAWLRVMSRSQSRKDARHYICIPSHLGEMHAVASDRPRHARNALLRHFSKPRTGRI
jgi:hypothetical protein